MRTLKWAWHFVLPYDLPLGHNNIFENVADILLLSVVLVCYNNCTEPIVFTILSYKGCWISSRVIIKVLRSWVIISSTHMWGMLLGLLQPVWWGSKSRIVHVGWPRGSWVRAVPMNPAGVNQFSQSTTLIKVLMLDPSTLDSKVLKGQVSAPWLILEKNIVFTCVGCNYLFPENVHFSP